MQLIILMGIVSIEKHQLTAEIANHFVDRGEHVHVVDNVQRLPLDSESVDAPLTRLVSDDVLTSSLPIFAEQNAQVGLLALSEKIHPETLMMSILDMETQWQSIAPQSPLHMTTIGMIDLRTCDCFPNIRVMIENNADIVTYVPYDLTKIIPQIQYQPTK